MKLLSILFSLFASVATAANSAYSINSIDNTLIHIQESGKGDSVVWLAGGPGMNPSYLEPIWNKNITVNNILLHQRGTGKSYLQEVNENTISMKKYVEDIEALRKHKNDSKLTLIGHSWGAMLAMEYATQFPQHIQKIILIGPGGIDTTYFKYFEDNILFRLPVSEQKEIAKLNQANKPTIKMLFPGYFFNRELALKIREQTDFSAIQGQNVWPHAINDYVRTTTYRLKNLKKYQGESYIIAGRQDPIGESTFYKIKAFLPQTEIHWIEKSGHFPWLEQPKEFSSLLTKLLNSRL